MKATQQQIDFLASKGLTHELRDGDSYFVGEDSDFDLESLFDEYPEMR